MAKPSIGILHYTAPPVAGGLEAVIQAHAGLLIQNGYPVTIIAGRGEQEAQNAEAKLILIPEIDSLNPVVSRMNTSLDGGEVPAGFDDFTRNLVNKLSPLLSGLDILIVHNILTKHFNLPLTAALHHMIESHSLPKTFAWCHDMTWTSPNSRDKVYPKYPWELLRTYKSEITYVAVSDYRCHELAMLLNIEPEQISVAYNGVDPELTLGLSEQGRDLILRLSLLAADLVILMPVRITQAKNIEFAIRALAALKSSGLSAKLVITGPPNPHDPGNMRYFQSLKELSTEHQLEDSLYFIFESGPDPEKAYFLDMRAVGDLYRVRDVLFMPSHREGFGMPVLEAGLIGIQVVTTASPAAVEVGGDDVTILSLERGPEEAAETILRLVQSSPLYRLRRRVSQEYTWQAIFERKIEPLLMP